MENIKFNFKYTCNYNNADIIPDNKCDYYRSDFLNLFNLEEYDQNVINMATDKLYEYIIDTSNDTNFKNIVLEYCRSKDEFIFLFAFDFLDKFHNCLKDLYLYRVVKKDNIDILRNSLDSK